MFIVGKLIKISRREINKVDVVVVGMLDNNELANIYLQNLAVHELHDITLK